MKKVQQSKRACKTINQFISETGPIFLKNLLCHSFYCIKKHIFNIHIKFNCLSPVWLINTGAVNQMKKKERI